MSLEELTRKMSKYYEKHDLDIEYKPNQVKSPTFKQSSFPALPELKVTVPALPNKSGQSNNTPPVKVPGGSLPKVNPTFNQPKPIPQNPYAKKVSPLPYNPAALQKAQQIQQQAKGMTADDLKRQNLANIKNTTVNDVKRAKDTVSFLKESAKAGISDAAASIQNAAMISAMEDVNKASGGENRDFVGLGKDVEKGKGFFNNAATIGNNLATNFFALQDRRLPSAVRKWLVEKLYVNDEQAKKMGFSNVDELAEALVQRLMAGDDWNEQLQKEYQALADTKEGATATVGNVVKGAAGMAPMIGANLLVPGAGLATAGIQSFGGSAMDALNQGATLEQAENRGALSAATEIATEKLVGGIPGMNKGLVKLGKWGDRLGEGAEEILSELASGAIDRATFDPDAQNATIEELLEAGLTGTAIATLLGVSVDTVNSVAKNVATAAKRGDNATAAKMAGALEADDPFAERLKSRAETPRISAEDFANTASPVWHNVELADKETQAKITDELSQKMRAEGKVVSVTDEDLAALDQYFPDLRSLKKKERLPLMKQSIADLKKYLRGVLSSYKDSSIDFTVNGNILEARLYNTGIDEVLEKVAQDKAAMLEKSREIFDKSEYLYSTQDKAGDPNIYRWNYFYVPLDVGGEQVGVRIAVRDMARQNESQVYNWGIKKGTNTAIDGGANSASPSATSVVPTDTIAEEQQPVKPALPYNPNAPKPIPQNPAQGKFGEPMGIVANPEAAARAQERRELFQPKPNPEGSRNIEGSVLDNLGQGQAAFATLDNLLAQSKADAAKKPGAKEGVANVLTQRPKKFAKDNLEEQIDKIARKVVDSGRTIDTIGKAVDDKVLYPLYNNAKQSRQAAEYMIGEAQTDINGNRVGESLVSIFDPIKAQGEDYFRDFSTYLYHLHNVDRMSLETNGAQVYRDAIMQLEAENPMLQNATREEVEALASGNSDYREAAIEWLQLDDSLNDLHNKPVFGESVTAEDSRKAAAELARKNPEFAELAEKVYAYNRNLMKYRVDTGLVSQKQADIMNTLYPHYVPTFRDTSSTTGMKIGGNQAKVARTVRSATGSNLDLLRIDDSMAEQTMQTVRAAKQNLLGARLLEDALKHQDKVGRHVRSVIDRYNSYDMDEPPRLGNDITIYVGGKPVSMQADDGVMEAFQSIQPRKGERIAGLEAVAKANNTFKRLVTGANPTFLLKNFARDLQDAGLYSGNLIDFAKNYPKAWQEMATGGELWQLYKSQGGTGSSYFDYEKGLKTEGKKNIFDRVEELNMMVEQAPRFAEFVSVLEKEGRTYEGIQKAMLAAADVTVNFGRGGSATQFLNRTFVPFLNPAVQGADKLVRRFSETKGAKEWVGLVGRLALMGVVPALLNELLYDDDEEYQMLNDRDKENNYVFPIGDGVWVKIPKGRALSVFGSAAQRTYRLLKGDKDAFNGFIQQAYDQVGVPNPLTNNIFSQVLNADLLDPESPGKTWYGSDIEPQRLQGLPPAERYDEKTDELSKWLGKQLNISPKKINYLLDNYSGVIGDFLLPLSTPQAERNPFAAAFTIDSVTSNKLSEEFYTKLDELEQAKNSKTPTAGAAAAYRYMNGVSSEVSANNKKIREIQNDKSLTDKEKLEQVRKIRNTNNKLLKDAVDNLPDYMETAGKSGVVSGKALDKVYLQTNYKQFGAEYALKKYDSAVYEKAKLANTRGISYEDYYKYKFSVDANGDGSVNQEEAKKQLDSMNLPSYQKAFLWEQQNKSWKKNPYK